MPRPLRAPVIKPKTGSTTEIEPSQGFTFPCEGVWIVTKKPGCTSTRLLMATYHDLPEVMLRASLEQHRDEFLAAINDKAEQVYQMFIEKFEKKESFNLPSRDDIVSAIFDRVAEAEIKRMQEKLLESVTRVSSERTGDH